VRGAPDAGRFLGIVPAPTPGRAFSVSPAPRLPKRQPAASVWADQGCSHSGLPQEGRANPHDRLDTHEHENPGLSRRGFSYHTAMKRGLIHGGMKIDTRGPIFIRNDLSTVFDMLPREVSPAAAGLGGAAFRRGVGYP